MRPTGETATFNVSPALVARANSFASEWSDLTTLWERRDWAALERAARRTGRPRFHIRLMAFFLRQSFARSPALLMLGAALYEQGQRERAMPMIRDYYENLEQGWTMGFMAVARYYLGLDALEKDDRETALHYLQEAYEYWELELIALRIEEITRAPFPRAKSQWEGKPFPCSYALPREDGRGTVSLAATGLPSGATAKLRVVMRPESTALNVIDRVDALAAALRDAGVPPERSAGLLAAAATAAMHAVVLDAVLDAAATPSVALAEPSSAGPPVRLAA